VLPAVRSVVTFGNNSPLDVLVMSSAPSRLGCTASEIVKDPVIEIDDVCTSTQPEGLLSPKRSFVRTTFVFRGGTLSVTGLGRGPLNTLPSNPRATTVTLAATVPEFAIASVPSEAPEACTAGMYNERVCAKTDFGNTRNITNVNGRMTFRISRANVHISLFTLALEQSNPLALTGIPQSFREA